jgi:hypothetical protein
MGLTSNGGDTVIMARSVPGSTNSSVLTMILIRARRDLMNNSFLLSSRGSSGIGPLRRVKFKVMIASKCCWVVPVKVLLAHQPVRGLESCGSAVVTTRPGALAYFGRRLCRPEMHRPLKLDATHLLIARDQRPLSTTTAQCLTSCRCSVSSVAGQDGVMPPSGT